MPNIVVATMSRVMTDLDEKLILDTMRKYSSLGHTIVVADGTPTPKKEKFRDSLKQLSNVKIFDRTSKEPGEAQIEAFIHAHDLGADMTWYTEPGKPTLATSSNLEKAINHIRNGSNLVIIERKINVLKTCPPYQKRYEKATNLVLGGIAMLYGDSKTHDFCFGPLVFSRQIEDLFLNSFNVDGKPVLDWAHTYLSRMAAYMQRREVSSVVADFAYDPSELKEENDVMARIYRIKQHEQIVPKCLKFFLENYK